ncbi:EboA domain-containing protein [Nocardioides sp.]|uniref:EboA domain-containing protein n=1 Tax=Nocardioides sp. TaxID=35761 RepID=UPI002736742D|nr:EboA domain-containing protein [Nocardioides sp.]MDP3890724.1 EboA domain-containing protein [Nocardioides sp.]
MTPLLPLDTLRDALGAAADGLDGLLEDIAADPTRLGRHFPAAARRTARGPLPGHHVLAEDAVRVALVVAAAAVTSPTELLAELRAMYRFGDSDEKRAVLLALHGAPDQLVAVDLLHDALRTNDTRLVAAAMGPHARHLDAAAWRHGVLKCLFTGVPVAAVADLATRADAELGAMAERFAEERRAAGRPVPDDLDTVIAATRRSSHTTARET